MFGLRENGVAGLLRGLLLAAFAVAGWASVAAAETPTVTDVRVGAHAQSTRFVLDVSDDLTFNVFTLANPYRVVIDLPEVGWRLPVQPLPENVGVLSRLRYGLFKPGVSRIVLDMDRPVAVQNTFVLAPGADHQYRFVLDLTEATPETFLARLGPVGQKTVSAGQGAPEPPQELDHTEVASVNPLRFPVPGRKPEYRPAPMRTVVIDPGHGGIDPGAISVNGVYEKHITLAMAKELRERLLASGKFNVVLTRNDDSFVQLRDRIQIARESKADLFVSVHADAIKNARVKGLSVYTLSEKASDREAAQLAESENKVDLIAGVDLSNESPEVTNILIDLAQRETMNQSSHFASLMVGELARETKLLRNSHRFAGFVVLKAPDVPSVLVELGFLSNGEEERALRTKSYRSKLARAMQRSIEVYFDRVEEASRR